MLYPRPLRLPLATGASVVRALSVPVGVFQLIAFGPMFLPVPDGAAVWIVFPLGIVWAGWFFAVVGAIFQGVRRRASDVVLSRDGVAIEGGPSRGLRVAWDRIDLTRTGVERSAEEGTHKLLLDGREVAVTSDDAERRSFQAIVDTIRAVCAPRDAAPEVAPGPRASDVLTCAACGAPAPIRDADEVTCRSCSAPVRVPEALRAQVRGLSSLEGARKKSERLLGVLLRQRGARYVNLLVLAATPPLVVGGPLAAITFNEFTATRHMFRWTHGVTLFICGLAFTYALALLVRAEVVGRTALRFVALSFHAKAPARPGDPLACRVCGAPLAEEPEKVVVLCVYCRAENLADVDLRGEADAASHQAGGLARALEERLGVRRRYRGFALLAAALLAAGAVSIQRTFIGPCSDGVRDGDETDIDCGGTCTRCLPGRACAEGADCRSGICAASACTEPRCDDGVRNGDESDVDCGGSCARCAAGKQCDGSAKNCASKRCELNGTCGRD